MLNRDQLQELGRFKLLMRRNSGESVQIERFLHDESYQTRLLDIAEEFDDDELLMLAITLRARLGRLGDGDEAFVRQQTTEQSDHPTSDAVVTSHLVMAAVVHDTTVTSSPQRLQQSVDQAPPRPKGLFGGFRGATAAQPTADDGQRYMTSLR